MNEPVPPLEQHHTAEDLVPGRLRRFVPLLGVIAISLSTVGFLTGIRDQRKPVRETVSETAVETNAPAAVTYSELATPKERQSLQTLQYEKPGIFDAVTRTEAMKLEALADRARNRAYDGAPPTIPHPVEVGSSASCLACHGEGLKVGNRVASKISHTHLSNCTQCHVEQVASGPTSAATVPDTAFVGVYRAGPGERASPGAPPTIPHHTWMRDNCMSCHGLVTRPGTRTTHPWLSNCTQCHAPSAPLDQRDFSGGNR